MQTPHQLARQSKSQFLEVFGGLYEHSSWIVERSFDEVSVHSQYNDLEAFHRLLCDIMLHAEDNLKMKLILAHPRLAGKKAQRNELTDFSTEEQKSAGLNHCSDKELTYITSLNALYFQRFNFDFIMAVKGKTKAEILRVFEQRLKRSKEQEMDTALEQINKIAWLRLQTLYQLS